MMLDVLPEYNASILNAFRSFYGILLALTVLHTMPQSARFFLSEKYKGYSRSTKVSDLVQSPYLLWPIQVLWLSCGLCLASGTLPLLMATVNFMLCRYYFVQMRWVSVTRGLGAPGYITYWLGFVVLSLEIVKYSSPNTQQIALLVFQLELAIIILTSGISKIASGYTSGFGFQFGLVNPQWSRFPYFYRRFAPNCTLFRSANFLAWSTQILAAVFMVYPETRFLGAVVLIITFIFIFTQIRLGTLCFLMMLSACLFFSESSGAVSIIESFTFYGEGAMPISSEWISLLISVLVFCYALFLPFAYAGMYLNYYAKKSLPSALQSCLERYTNFWGMILWRVFTIDVIEFYVDIYHLNGNDRTLISRWGSLSSARFSHVGEAIAVTCLFTLRKYLPDNRKLFEERLLRYAKSLSPESETGRFEFEYIRILPAKETFEFSRISSVFVDIARGTIQEKLFDLRNGPERFHPASSGRIGKRLGSYAP